MKFDQMGPLLALTALLTSPPSSAIASADDELLRQAIPPRPPQVTYDPHLADVGSCQWRELDAATKRLLFAASEKAPPFVVVMAAQQRLVLPSYISTKQCDPGFWSHTDASYVARLTGVMEGLSLERLEQFHIHKARVEAVWQADATLRTAVTSLFKGASLDPPMTPRTGEALRPVFQQAWLEMGQKPSQSVVDGGAAEAAAWSYWLARGWETVVVEPMSGGPLKDGAAGSLER
jgi:hypothetical protein